MIDSNESDADLLGEEELKGNNTPNATIADDENLATDENEEPKEMDPTAPLDQDHMHGVPLFYLDSVVV